MTEAMYTPPPVETPNLMVLGFFLEASMRSARVLYGESAGTTMFRPTAWRRR
jgi:hypothetical protein